MSTAYVVEDSLGNVSHFSKEVLSNTLSHQGNAN